MHGILGKNAVRRITFQSDLVVNPQKSRKKKKLCPKWQAVWRLLLGKAAPPKPQNARGLPRPGPHAPAADVDEALRVADGVVDVGPQVVGLVRPRRRGDGGQRPDGRVGVGVQHQPAALLHRERLVGDLPLAVVPCGPGRWCGRQGVA